MSNLSSVIKSIQDIMRQDSGVDGDAQRISQLTWLLFLKVFDALEEELELTRDDYKSPIPEAMRWRNWATDAEGITGDALLDFVNNQLFATLKSLSGDAQRNPRGYVVRGVFEDAYNYMKSGQLLRQVINKLNAIDFNRQAERHQFNDLYEKILKDLQSAGNAGEFYTPRAVTQFMVDMVNPQLGEVVLDPFEPGNLCQRWLDMGMVCWTQLRTVAPNQPPNLWHRLDDDATDPALPFPATVPEASAQYARGIQYPITKPAPGEWHSPWNAYQLEPSKEAIRLALRYHITHPDSPLRYITTEMINLPDYGLGARYNLLQHNIEAAKFVRRAWDETVALHAAGLL